MGLPSFEFATSGLIWFGRGKALGAAQAVTGLHSQVLLVSGRDASRADWLREALVGAGCEVTDFSTPHEPTVELIETGVAVARTAQVGVVVALGGGATIDAAKAIAALAPGAAEMHDHLEVVGRARPLDHAPLPCVAIPTTSGTGAEVTRNAVIAVPEAARKVSLRDRRMVPDLAIVDPALTDTCPRAVTLASGLDAITQVIEPYLSTRANPLTDAICRSAIPTGLAALNRLMMSSDTEARDQMAWTSVAGGLALANAGLGVIHGLAGPLGGLSNAAHGAICGALLPHGLLANERNSDDAATLARITEIKRWIAQALDSTQEHALDALAQWSRSQGLPGLAALGISQEACAAAADAAALSSSMRANPVALDKHQLSEIMENAQ